MATAKKSTAKKSAASAAAKDATALLEQDHREVKKLFKQYEKLGEKAYTSKREVVDRIITELSVHAAIEEQVFYPAVRESVPKEEDTVLESLEEHHVVKWVLSELEKMSPEDERFDAKVTVLIENVRHHIEEEEEEWFPKVREGLDRKTLQEIGAEMEKARKKAPRSPAQPSALKKTIDAVIS